MNQSIQLIQSPLVVKYFTGQVFSVEFTAGQVSLIAKGLLDSGNKVGVGIHDLLCRTIGIKYRRTERFNKRPTVGFSVPIPPVIPIFSIRDRIRALLCSSEEQRVRKEGI